MDVDMNDVQIALHQKHFQKFIIFFFISNKI